MTVEKLIKKLSNQKLDRSAKVVLVEDQDIPSTLRTVEFLGNTVFLSNRLVDRTDPAPTHDEVQAIFDGG